VTVAAAPRWRRRAAFAGRRSASATLAHVMGSVIKKRRRKIARHKYRKRLKRERFKRRRA